MRYLTSALCFLACCVSARCQPKAEGDHLKIMTFYGMMPEVQHGWTNVYRGDLATWKNTTITKTWKMKILLSLSGKIFTRNQPPPGVPKNSLFPQWQSEVDTFVAAATPQIQAGKAIGVFMGDEICCSGTPYTNLSSVADRLRAGLGKTAWIYTNECSEMASWPKLVNGEGGVPAALDAIGVDFYDEKNTDGAAEVAKNRDFYSKTIFPRLHPHQQVIFVPGIFASSPAGCESKGVHCPLEDQAQQIVIKLDGFFEWAKTEPRVAGFNPWHFNNRSHDQYPLPYDQKLGAISMPSVVAKLKEIGEYISSPSQRSQCMAPMSRACTEPCPPCFEDQQPCGCPEGCTAVNVCGCCHPKANRVLI